MARTIPAPNAQPKARDPFWLDHLPNPTPTCATCSPNCPRPNHSPEVEALLPTRLDPDTLTRYSPQGPIINPRQ